MKKGWIFVFIGVVVVNLIISLFLYKEVKQKFGTKEIDKPFKSTLDKVKERGVLIAGVRRDVVPMGYYDETQGTYLGFDVDVVRYIADKLGVKLELEGVTSSTRIPTLVEGKIDLFAASTTHTRAREETIDFSVTYFMDGQSLLVRKQSGIRSYLDLERKKVGVVKESTSEKNISAIQTKCIVVPFEKYPDVFSALKRGEIDAMTTDSLILTGLKGKDDTPEMWEIVGGLFSKEPYGIGLPQNDSKWRDFINLTLMEMWENGTWQNFYNKWFGPDTKFYLPTNFEMELWPR